MQRRTFLNLGLAGLGTTLALGSTAPLPGSPAPLQYVPRPSKEKWAILFGTWYGTARDASVWISEGMGGIASVFDVRQKPDLAPFEHLILGTAIQGGKGPPLFNDYIESNLARIQGKVRGLFAVCGNLERPVGPQQTKDYIEGYLAKLCKAGAVPSRVFNGRITKVLMSEAEYKVVEDLYKQLKMPPLEDYDYLRRPDCLKFGAEVMTRKP